MYIYHLYSDCWHRTLDQTREGVAIIDHISTRYPYQVSCEVCLHYMEKEGVPRQSSHCDLRRERVRLIAGRGDPIHPNQTWGMDEGETITYRIVEPTEASDPAVDWGETNGERLGRLLRDYAAQTAGAAAAAFTTTT